MNIPRVCALYSSTLADSLSSSGTSFTLTDGNDMAGTALSGLYCFIIDEGETSQEFILGTVSSSVVTVSLRGLDPQDAKTERAALKFAHNLGATVKITDYSLIGVLALTANGTEGFPNKLKYNANPTFSDSKEIPDKKYVDEQVVAGAPGMNTTTKGIAEEATTAEIDANTQTGSTGAELAINPYYLSLSKYLLQLPSSGQKDALVGTSGTPGSSNKYVTNDDVSASIVSNRVVRRDGNGDVIVNNTPGGSGAAGSKAYIDLGDPTITDNGVTVSNDLINSDDTEKSLTTNTYLKIKEVKISVAPSTVTSLRIKFSIKTNSSGQNAFGRIYKNGVAIGTERENATPLSYVEYSEDLGTFAANDLIQIYAHTNGGATVYCENFRFYGMDTQTITKLKNVTLNTPIAGTDSSKNPTFVNQDP